MASNTELVNLWRENATLRDKVVAAVWKAAIVINSEDPATANHAERLVWAKNALADGEATAKQMLPYLLAANAGLTKAQFDAVSDAAVQTAVDGAVNLFAL